ncbi:MAG: hypothetical protein ACPW61_08995 [Methyloligella sp. ZOD6]
MATYCVSFRISNQTLDGRSYSERRAELIKAVRQEDMGYWEETTSFILVESELSTNEFAEMASKLLSKEHDMLFVFDPEDMSACYFGAVEHAEVLKSFFPRLKKVP